MKTLDIISKTSDMSGKKSFFIFTAISIYKTLRDINRYFIQAIGSNIFLVAFSAKDLTCLIMGEGLHLSATTFLIVFTPIRRISSIDLVFTSLP